MQIVLNPECPTQVSLNLETGTVTIYAQTEEDIPRAIDYARERGWL